MADLTAKGKESWREIEARMGVLHTALNKVEASITRNKARLEESQIQEDEVCHED